MRDGCVCAAAGPSLHTDLVGVPCIVLVGLYENPEKPEDAVEYIRKTLGLPEGVDVDALQSENARLAEENASLKAEVAALKAQLDVSRV